MALVTAGGGVASAKGRPDDRGNGPTAEIRVGHLSPDAPAVDVYVGPSGLDPTDDDTDPVIAGLEYPNFAPNASGGYLEIPACTYDVSVTPAGAPDTEVIDVDGLELAANSDSTVLAVGELNAEEETEPELQPLPLVDNADDDTALPPADATLVRLVHVSPDAGAVDLVVEQGGDEVTAISDVTFGQDTGYLELPPGNYTVDVGPGALSIPVFLIPGTKISGYVIGNATTAGEDDAGLGATFSLEATSPAFGRGDGDGNDDENHRDEHDE